jgi:hypothetical protein
MTLIILWPNKLIMDGLDGLDGKTKAGTEFFFQKRQWAGLQKSGNRRQSAGPHPAQTRLGLGSGT